MTQKPYDTVTSTCKNCGVTFEQFTDPGRRRQFCSSACRQAAYRARTGKTGHEAASQRKAHEQERRERDARRARERRAREAQEQAARTGADWTRPRATDTPAQAKARARGRKLLDLAQHPRTNPHEADNARNFAERLRKKHGF
jgi:hypothetical protein